MSMKAIILNSGLGNRMGELTEELPKCLVELSRGETILSRQVDFLLRNNIRKIIITTGPFDDKIENYLQEKYTQKIKDAGTEFTFLRNTRYQTTNYIYSLYLARDAAQNSQEILLMHGDLVFTDSGPLQLLSSPYKDSVLVDSSPQLPEKDFKCRLRDGLIVEIGVNLFGEDCRFLFPMYRLSMETYNKWLDEMARFVDAGKTNVYAENALNEILENIPLYPVFYENLFCAEVDDKEDLEKALKNLY